MMESNKCIKSRAKELSNEMLLACQSAAIGDFRNVTIKNKVKEINLKPIQVEYELDISEKQIYLLVEVAKKQYTKKVMEMSKE